MLEMGTGEISHRSILAVLGEGYTLESFRELPARTAANRIAPSFHVGQCRRVWSIVIECNRANRGSFDHRVLQDLSFRIVRLTRMERIHERFGFNDVGG